MSAPCFNYLGVSRRRNRNVRSETYLIEHVARAYLSPEEHASLTVIWPYFTRRETHALRLRRAYQRISGKRPATVFLTHENEPPRWDFAPYQIGFYPDQDNPNYLRFPNWLLQLDWPQLPTQPKHNRFGPRLDIDSLMQPLNQRYADTGRKPGAVMFSSHLRGPRQQVYEVTNATLGCEGHGMVFNNDSRKSGGKHDISTQFSFALCPENSAGHGYVTEKIPEAFFSGCIPITWVRPEDLALDFNPRAVVNLYGMSREQQTSTLEQLAKDHDAQAALRNEPLLLQRPTLEPLIAFLQRIARRQ